MRPRSTCRLIWFWPIRITINRKLASSDTIIVPTGDSFVQRPNLDLLALELGDLFNVLVCGHLQ
jgi:hypothetical protein